MKLNIPWNQHPVAPAFLALALLGALPVSTKPAWRLVGFAKPLRSSLPLCVLTFCALAVLALRGELAHAAGAVSAERYNDKIIAALGILTFIPILLMPCIWLESEDQQANFDAFLDFKRWCEAVAERTLDVHVLRRRCLLTVLLVFVSNAGITVALYLMRDSTALILSRYVGHPETYMSMSYSYIVYELVVIGEVTIHETLALTGRLVATLLEEAGDIRQLRRVRALVLELFRMLDSNGSYTMNVGRVLLSFTTATLATYLLFASLAMKPPNYATCAALALVALVHLVIIYLMCHSAHRATAQVSARLLDALDTCSFKSMEAEWLDEVAALYSSVAAKPLSLSLCGFSAVGRPLLASLAVSMVGYLVVLLQFA